MIFQPELIEKILAGEKTVTRRPVRYANPESRFSPYPCRYKPGGGPGGAYALQGPPEKGSRARARTIPGYRLRVTRVNLEAVGIIDTDEARLEGFPSALAFKRYWQMLYGSFEPAQLVYRIEFELLDLNKGSEESNG